MLRPGYAVEYDFIQPTELDRRSKRVACPACFSPVRSTARRATRKPRLRGSLAGINAARSARGERRSCFGRDEAYIGVLVDDLVTRGMPRAVPDVHVARGAPAASENRQRRSAAHACRRAIGLVDDSRWEPFEGRRAPRTQSRSREELSVGAGPQRMPACRALRQPSV